MATALTLSYHESQGGYGDEERFYQEASTQEEKSTGASSITPGYCRRRRDSLSGLSRANDSGFDGYYFQVGVSMFTGNTLLRVMGYHIAPDLCPDIQQGRWY